MFILAKLEDTVVIHPKYFGTDLKETIEHELNARFANKLVYKVGLCISLWDLLEVQESFISDVDGAYHTAVTFRFVCFRPAIGEVLLGTVKSCSKSGIRVSLNFFDEVYIPVDKLRHPSKFDYEQSSWIWEYDYEGETAELRIDKNDTIRFRVVEEIWQDPNPDGSKTLPGATQEPSEVADSLNEDQFSHNVAYTIIGSVVSDGLGVTCWWIS
ncbi:DNA-directed RNA polymerase III subunit RPC8 [Clonorchis sinensis]|uniref:DNA-directed RNA polymerase III subunit RPC8 n=1 Tax=Clonorchis sinensis TaxID=79923 RepID=A0A8T1M3Z6_CLOSI|nr:DNA-directed RNA polymerase III subunit RPC8 [Clonorchis sinensis]